MKNMLRTLIAGLLLLSLPATPAFAQNKIATVDLRKIFDNYWKKKQAEAALKERQADMEKEDKNMLDDYRKMKEDYASLVSKAGDENISPTERDKRKKAAEDKLKQVKDLEDTIAQYERQARTTISDQSQRMRASILTEIRTVVNGKAKSGNFSLVIDTAAESINSTPVILYTNNENDLTDDVVKELNATAPADLPKTEEKAAPKKDEKKK